jgi:hypothetical protein
VPATGFLCYHFVFALSLGSITGWMELVDAEEELVRWPYEYQFFIRDCGVLYISLARISTVAPSFSPPGR